MSTVNTTPSERGYVESFCHLITDPIADYMINPIHKNVISPALDSINSGYESLKSSTNDYIAKPIVNAYQFAAPVINVVDPILTGVVGLGGTAALIKGAYDYQNSTTTKVKEQATLLMKVGAAGLTLTTLRLTLPYVFSYFAPEEKTLGFWELARDGRVSEAFSKAWDMSTIKFRELVY